MASLRQKFHLVDNGLMAHVQSAGSEGVGRGRGEVFDERFHSEGQPRSPECQPQVNKCVIDVGTAPVSPREAPSAFFFSSSDGHCGWLCCG